MSRRIALSVIAAVAALTATPALADNDCFDPATCPPAEETLAREQRMLEERAAELKAEEARAAEAEASKAAAEQAAREQAMRDEEAARAQAAQTQRAMEEAARAEEQAASQAASTSQAPSAAAIDSRARDVEMRNKAAEEQARREIAEQEKAARELAEQREQQLQRDLAMREDLERRARLAAEQPKRMPNVVEPPAPAVAAAAATASPATPATAPQSKPPVALNNITGIVPPSSTVPPKHIVRPPEPAYAERTIPQQPAKRVADAPRPQPVPAVRPSAPARAVTRVSDEPREAPRAAYPAPIISSAAPAQPAPLPPVQIVKGGKAATVVIVRTATYEDGITPAVANVRPDPAVKFCQTDLRADGRYVYCNQGSYHPYGANGYRPLGSYQAYRTAPAYITVQPEPRIVSLRAAD
jgi:hypothetical protein